jgi:hypothetical protein
MKKKMPIPRHTRTFDIQGKVTTQFRKFIKLIT